MTLYDGGRGTGWKLKGAVENEVRESLLLASRERRGETEDR